VIVKVTAEKCWTFLRHRVNDPDIWCRLPIYLDTVYVVVVVVVTVTYAIYITE